MQRVEGGLFNNFPLIQGSLLSDKERETYRAYPPSSSGNADKVMEAN